MFENADLLQTDPSHSSRARHIDLNWQVIATDKTYTLGVTTKPFVGSLPFLHTQCFVYTSGVLLFKKLENCEVTQLTGQPEVKRLLCASISSSIFVGAKFVNKIEMFEVKWRFFEVCFWSRILLMTNLSQKAKNFEANWKLWSVCFVSSVSRNVEIC